MKCFCPGKNANLVEVGKDRSNQLPQGAQRLSQQSFKQHRLIGRELDYSRPPNYKKHIDH